MNKPISVDIHEAKEGEFASIAKVFNDNYPTEFYDHEVARADRFRRSTQEQILKLIRISDNEKRFITASRDNTVIGFIEYELFESTYQLGIHISWVMTDRTQQRKSVATQLYSHLEEQMLELARIKGKKQVLFYFSAHRDNHPSELFSEIFGYKTHKKTGGTVHKSKTITIT